MDLDANPPDKHAGATPRISGLRRPIPLAAQADCRPSPRAAILVEELAAELLRVAVSDEAARSVTVHVNLRLVLVDIDDDVGNACQWRRSADGSTDGSIVNRPCMIAMVTSCLVAYNADVDVAAVVHVGGVHSPTAPS